MLSSGMLLFQLSLNLTFHQRFLSCSLSFLFYAVWFASELKLPYCESCLVASASGTWLLGMRARGTCFSLCSWESALPV